MTFSPLLRHPGASGLLLILGMLLPALPIHAQDAQALITELAGAVQIVRAETGSTVDAVWGTQLYSGDQVETLDGATASILFTNNNLITLGANSAMAIAGGPGADAPSQGVRRVEADLIAGVDDLTVRREGDDLAALGGLRAGGRQAALEPLSPRNTLIKTTQPSFAWHAAEPFEAYEVKVFNSDGVVWRGTVTEPSATYPADAPALEPGTAYFWQVEGDDLLNPVASQAVPFEVLSADRLAAVEAREASIRATFGDAADGSDYRYVLGAYYAKEGLLDAAIVSFLQIAERHPESPLAQEILGKLYEDVGLKDQAIGSLRRSLLLRQ